MSFSGHPGSGPAREGGPRIREGDGRTGTYGRGPGRTEAAPGNRLSSDDSCPGGRTPRSDRVDEKEPARYAGATVAADMEAWAAHRCGQRERQPQRGGRVFRAMRAGTYDEAELEQHLDSRGFMNRILGRFMKSITRPGQMFPMGFLFGLGFDTATEVTLMVMAGSGAAAGLPWYAILCLALLFAAGMSLFDALDGTFMNFAYQWAFSTRCARCSTTSPSPGCRSPSPSS